MKRHSPIVKRRDLLARASVLLTPAALLHVNERRNISPRSVVNAYFRSIESRDVESILTFFAPGAVYEDVTFEFRIAGHQELRRMFQSVHAGLNPVKHEIRRLIADGPQVVVEWIATGTHAGDMLGVKPTGRMIIIRAVSLIEVTDERIVRVTDYTDRVGLEKQLRQQGSSETVSALPVGTMNGVSLGGTP